MLRAIASTVLYVLGNALGIIVASLLLDGFEINLISILLVSVVFTVIVAVMTPFFVKISIKHVPQMSGGVALVAILVGLFVTSLLTDGLKITGLQTWILAPLVIWIVSLIAGLVLPLVLFRKTLEKHQEGKQSK